MDTAQAAILLKTIHNFSKPGPKGPPKLYPMFAWDFQMIRNEIRIRPEQVIKDELGNDMILLLPLQELKEKLQDKFKLLDTRGASANPGKEYNPFKTQIEDVVQEAIDRGAHS